jgi:hypothetical protein
MLAVHYQGHCNLRATRKIEEKPWDKKALKVMRRLARGGRLIGGANGQVSCYFTASTL